jgi:ketosteroid isomerase-like protein
MPQENVEVVRAFYEQPARGDFSVLDDLPDDFAFVTSDELPDAGTYRGSAAVQFIRDWIASFDDLTISATEIVDAGDKVVIEIVQSGRPIGSDKQVEGRWWQTVAVREGQIAAVETFQRCEDALEAAGLRE